MKTYVLTRLDLKEKQQFIQAMHALVDICIYNPKIAKEWNNSNLVVLGVKDQFELNFWIQEIDKTLDLEFQNEHGLLYRTFHEPWYEEDTAMAVFDIDGRIGNLLRKLPLL